MTIKSKGGAAMKKSYDVRKRFGRKNMVMCLVALILVMITVVGTSYSWIEEVSKVEFNSDNGQETPYKMKAAPLNAEANIVNNSTEIDFSKYFNEGGDMHLSPCYSDGEKFYFPVNNTSGSDKFRLGTKDDANTNYISSTFKVKAGSENTAFWFEKIEASTPYLSLKTHSGSTASTFPENSESYLRFSVTVDGSTNVYCLNSSGTYKTVSGISATGTTTNNGRCVETYAYYDPTSSLSEQTANRNVPNQNSDTDNLHCNTLFTVPKGQTKVVTLKIWLECRGSGTSRNVRDVAISNINFKLTSSWAKMRRIYVLDRTISQDGFDNLDTGSNDASQWLASYGSTLSWGLKSNLDTHFDLVADGTQTIDGKAYKRYYADIPTVYNGADVVFFRCGSSYGTGDSDKTYEANGKSKHYRNMWETTFPNTFHNETFHVYTSDYGTWDEDANSVYIVNSAFFTKVCDYMWDSNSVHGNGINDKVVKNADWPGKRLTTKAKTKTASQSLDPYAFYYNADYDRVIFNDGDLVEGQNQEYQTQDLWLTNSEKNCTFDMATLTWFHTNPSKSDWNTKMPSYSASNTYLECNISTNNQWKKTRFAYGGEYSNKAGNAFNGTSSSKMLCKIYCKAAGDYEMVLYNNGQCYKAYKSGEPNLYAGGSYTLGLGGDGSDYNKNLYLKNLKAKTVYRIYFEWDNGRPKVSLAEGEANVQ